LVWTDFQPRDADSLYFEKTMQPIDLRKAFGLPERKPRRNPLNWQKFDELPKHHPCSPWKYEERMDNLNEFIAEPTPVEDMLPLR